MDLDDKIKAQKQAENHKKQPNGVVAYVFLPGIMPQIRELTRGGFGYLAFLIATIYQSVKILPENHPFTRVENIGTFGLRHVVAVAANNVKVDRQHLDQIVIFFAVLAGIMLLFMQALSFLVLIFSGDAFAADSLFATANPQEDIAFHMLRETFGIPNMFGDMSPTAFHSGLHKMFEFYNYALLLVAVVIFLYYVIVVVAETAQTGTPFGKRFSHVYAPIRLVVAIGLLVPLNYGFNGAQYIALYSAKIGSGFATTGWTEFNKVLGSSNPLGAENATLLAETKPPDFTGLVSFMATVTTCKQAYKVFQKKDIICEGSYIEKGETKTFENCSVDNIEGAASTSGNQDITLKFGMKEEEEFIPYCGIVIIPINVPLGEMNRYGAPGNIQKEYIKIVTEQLYEDEKLNELGKNLSKTYKPGSNCVEGSECFFNKDSIQIVMDKINTTVTKKVQDHYKEGRKSVDFKMPEEVLKRGWGGAGIWYNEIAQVNGAYVVSTLNIPSGKDYPKVMQEVQDEKSRGEGTITLCNAFEPNLADNANSQIKGVRLKYAQIFNDAYKSWHCEKRGTSNFVLDAISAVFGLQGLMSIREKATVKGEGGEEDKTINIHPLAKLSALGRGLVESAVRNMGFAVGTSFLGGILGIISPHFESSMQAASSMFVSIATIGLSIGFITFYILPFLPFMYFFFAVGGWVKGIFEAMVGAPLWALAHLRIDGDGLSGKNAAGGYFLIFEIFLRPILTVFGLIGGMAIFTAMANMLNEVFNLVVCNVGGAGTCTVDLADTNQPDFSRHTIDIFFFTCVYALILYLMALSSFKMINLVPNNIMRWIGANVEAYNDGSDDPTQNLIQYAAIGGAKVGGSLAQGVQQLGTGTGKGIQGLWNAANPKESPGGSTTP